MLLAMWLSVSAAEKQPDPKTIVWRLIYTGKDPTFVPYVNTKSILRKNGGIGDYGSAEILFSANKIFTSTVDGKPVVAKSLVRHLLIECESAILAPVIDYYFTVSKPTRADKPIVVVSYDNLEGATLVSKKSPVYNTLCPVSI